MSIRIQIENYRVLRKVDWELPKGVCPLVGPNGSGKTTLLRSLRFLRECLANGVGQAIATDGSVDGFRRMDAKVNKPVRIAIDLDHLSWSVEIAIDRHRIVASGEAVYLDGSNVLLRELGTQKSTFGDKSFNGDGGFRQFALERFPSEDPSLGPLSPPVSYLSDYRLYEPITFEQLREGSAFSTAQQLIETGLNLFSVMRHWNDRRENRRKLEFIKSTIKQAFPDIFEDMDFESSKDRVTGLLHIPGGARPLPMSAAPTGLLNLLYVLCAVVSTEPGGIVAIDEPENALHPFAIQKFVDAATDWAADHDLTVLLATHSPVLLDRFKDSPEMVFVMDPSQASLPVRLSDLHDREWLVQFSLGDLYKHGDFGAPVEVDAAS